MPFSKKVLPIIVLSQFFCTSLWFAGNGVMSDLISTFDLKPEALGHLTSAVQLGFIFGTLSFAFLSIADRFSPSKVFFVCAIFGAIFNLGLIFKENSFYSLMLLRFLTGFSLAGIYPVGMKIAADYYQKGLGRSLGYLVGALVLGTAFPHLLKSFTGSEGLPWRLVILLVSGLSLLGGILIFFGVPDGPFRKGSTAIDFSAFLKVFRNQKFRAAAFGYFGHMWELYTFWAFVPVILGSYNLLHPGNDFNIPLLSFVIIGIGSLSCIAGGYISLRLGTKTTAGTSLFISGFCCLLSPFILLQDSALILLSFLGLWGLSVVADSPLFSTLVAKNAPSENKGTALTIVNCLGFAITIPSIQLINYALKFIELPYVFLLLTLGPAVGLWKLFHQTPGQGPTRKAVSD